MTRTIPLIIALIIAAILTIVLCTFISPAGFGFVSTAPGAADIVGGIRLPRVLAAFFVGASLAVARVAAALHVIDEAEWELLPQREAERAVYMVSSAQVMNPCRSPMTPAPCSTGSVWRVSMQFGGRRNRIGGILPCVIKRLY